MENKENVRGITASVRFQDAEIIKEGRALSFLRDLEDSKSFVGNENEGTTNASNTTNDRVDVPDRMTQNYGINSVRNDLHRFSVHVGQQLATGNSDNNRLVGQLFVKGRGLLSRWNKMLGSIAVHSNFGPVFFLFRYDARGGLLLRDSLMIVLSGAVVREGRSVKGYSAFKIKTEKKKWLFACLDSTVRDHWIQEIQLLKQM